MSQEVKEGPFATEYWELWELFFNVLPEIRVVLFTYPKYTLMDIVWGKTLLRYEIAWTALTEITMHLTTFRLTSAETCYYLAFPSLKLKLHIKRLIHTNLQFKCYEQSGRYALYSNCRFSQLRCRRFNIRASHISGWCARIFSLRSKDWFKAHKINSWLGRKTSVLSKNISQKPDTQTA